MVSTHLPAAQHEGAMEMKTAQVLRKVRDRQPTHQGVRLQYVTVSTCPSSTRYASLGKSTDEEQVAVPKHLDPPQ